MADRLSGHSAGGQLVERFAGFDTVAAVRLIAASPSAALVPNRDCSYRHGFGGLPDRIANDDTIVGRPRHRQDAGLGLQLALRLPPRGAV